MSLSPSESVSMSSDHTQQLYQANSHKRKRTSFSSSDAPAQQYPDGQANAQSGPSEATNGANGTNGPQSHIPKRGARACTACRKGKNRRLSRLEGQYLVMQSQMIGMQSSLDRILGALQPGASPQQAQNPAFPAGQATANGAQQSYPPPTPTEISGFPASIPPLAANGSGPAYYPPSDERSLPVRVVEPPPKFPPLPGFAPPPHKFATYGIVPSTAPSSDDESEETLPRSSLNAPIEALQGLANAAAEAAAAPLSSQRKKRKRVEPTPRNAFPNVLDKGLVAESEARELYTIFFSGCHLFIPLFDPAYDTFEGLRDRTPFCFDAILAVASKIRAGTGPPSATFHRCLEEAQGIARSTLFGPVVRKEAVQGATMDEEALMRKILSGELMFAKVWLVCVALRGVNWDKMPFEQRELAFQAKEAASNCLATFLQSPEYRAALRYAVHDSLVTAAFSGLFLLKIANLFPAEVDINAITIQVEQLAQLLSEVAAERYALTIRLMLANLRRKIGMQSIQPTPTIGGDLVGPYGDPQPTATANFSLEDFGFSWPDGVFSPTNIPMWLQEANLSDLGMPSNAYDGIFIPMNTGWSGDIGLMPEAW
ncbi:hypothetical protein FRC00_002104 [Tulasnella sp. 408]|nr:hypothetical protein FRC00_002104 [Tulasnella sp. 408]